MQKKKLLETITIWKAFITWSHNPATICNIQCWKAPIQDLFVMCIYIYIYILLSANSLSDIYEAWKTFDGKSMWSWMLIVVLMSRQHIQLLLVWRFISKFYILVLILVPLGLPPVEPHLWNSLRKMLYFL